MNILYLYQHGAWKAGAGQVPHATLTRSLPDLRSSAEETRSHEAHGAGF